MNIDTSAARDSLGFKTARSLNRDAAVFGKQAAADATGRYAQMGNQMMQIQKRGDDSRNCTEPDDGSDKRLRQALNSFLP